MLKLAMEGKVLCWSQSNPIASPTAVNQRATSATATATDSMSAGVSNSSPSTDYTTRPFSPSSSTTSTHHSPATRHRTSSSSAGDELGTLKHQLRLLKAENLNLKEKLGTKPNPAPFGQSLPRRPSGSGPSLSPPPPSLNRSLSAHNLRRGTTSPDRSTSPLPGAVSLTRALLADDLSPPPPPVPPIPPVNISPTLDSPSSPSFSQPQLSHPPASPNPSRTYSNGGGGGGGGGVRTSTENPFFGSGASRERLKNSQTSAASGSGKVISGLQSELISVKGALESARSQLRLSQKAVEFLTRQNEDLKESKERLSTTVEQLNTMLSRKTRLHEDLTTRLSTSEQSLQSLQSTHSTLLESHTSKIETLEKENLDAVGMKVKVESEYEALRSGMRNMAEGWKKDLEWVKEDFGKLNKKREREVEDQRLKIVALNKLCKERESSQSSITSTLSSLHALEQSFQSHFSKLFKDLSSSLDPLITSPTTKTPEKEQEEFEALKIARNLEDELKRLRRLIQNHNHTAPTS